MPKHFFFALLVSFALVSNVDANAAEPVTFPSGSGWKECPSKNRKRIQHGCVHDGDTFWFSGSKYRLACINAVELSTVNGIKARDMLVAALNRPGTTITDTGTTDRYRRQLAIVSGFDKNIMASGLAVDPDYRNTRTLCRKNR